MFRHGECIPGSAWEWIVRIQNRRMRARKHPGHCPFVALPRTIRATRRKPGKIPTIIKRRPLSFAATIRAFAALAGCASSPITRYETSTNGVSFESSYQGLGLHSVNRTGPGQPLLRAAVKITRTWLVPETTCYATWTYNGPLSGGNTLNEYTSIRAGDRIISLNTAYRKKAVFYVIPLIPDSFRRGLGYDQYVLQQRARGQQFNWSLPNTPGIGTFLVSGSTGKTLHEFFVYGYNGEPLLDLTKSTCVFIAHSERRIKHDAIHYEGTTAQTGKLLFRIDGIYGEQNLEIAPNDTRWFSVPFGRYRGVGLRVVDATGPQIEIRIRDLDTFGYRSASSDMMSVVQTETRLPLRPN